MTAKPVINRTVLMSGADFFDVVPLNPFSHGHSNISRERAVADFERIKAAVEEAGIKVVKIDPPAGCQDGVFTANWGVCRSDTVVLSSLPPQRQAEQPAAEAALRALGKRIVKAPYRFSGQGDCLPMGNRLLAGSGHRTDPRMHRFLADELGYEVISVETVPERDASGKPVINQATGWPDSYFYDLDLAVGILSPNLIAWCPEAFTPESQAKIRALADVDKIEVEVAEDLRFCCNLVSTGHTVVMGPHAPHVRAAIEARGLEVVAVSTPELAKGGGGIRCSALTLDNE